MSQREDAVMEDALDDDPQHADGVDGDAPLENIFVAPSVSRNEILAGDSYTHHSPVPDTVSRNPDTECVLGVDEAGRGPVLGPMVYALYYLPIEMEQSLLKDTYHFDDSKALTPAVRSNLMKAMCTVGTDLHQTSGWATRVMSARSIASNMMLPNGTYNLNAQAMDATIDLIHGVFERGVNVKEIYIDTIGRPETYQKKLEKIFPTTKVTVAKKADSLYPCVSAASVCAKVTRDAALEVCYEAYQTGEEASANGGSWGSGYPSDVRCSSWLKRNMDPVFGWGSECRFSWGTAKDLLEGKAAKAKVEWPEEATGSDNLKLTSFFMGRGDDQDDMSGLSGWFGRPVTDEVF